MQSNQLAIRSKTIQSISIIKKSINCVSRNSMFLAISILDRYLLAMPKTQNDEGEIIFDEKIYSIACYILAWKFDGDQCPSMEILGKTLTVDLPVSSFVDEVKKAEQKILIGIDFLIPNMTAYQALDETIPSKELENEELRRHVAISIKIILIAVTISFELSLDPSLGLHIHQITKKTGKVKPEAKTIYRKCLKFLKEEGANLSQCIW